VSDTIILSAVGIFFAVIFIASRLQTLKDRKADPAPRSDRRADYSGLLSGCGWLTLVAVVIIAIGALFKIGWNLF
jgi:hypothetical protein